MVTTPVAQQYARLDGAYSYVAAAAGDGVQADALVDRVRAQVPEHEVLSRAEYTAQRAESFGWLSGAISGFVTIFGLISLFVAAFIMHNTFSILVAVADRIAPAGGGFPSAEELQVAEKIDGLLARMDPAVGGEIKQVLLLLENALAGLVFDGRTKPFTRMMPEAQDDALRSWQNSRLDVRRTAYTALHGLCAAAYYASPEIYPLVGYPGPPDFRGVTGSAP